MFRLWCKLFDNSNHLVKDVVIKNADGNVTRTRKILDGISSACYELNLAEPIWLDVNIRDFQRYSKVRFIQDNFIDTIDFSYMEVQVIEED